MRLFLLPISTRRTLIYCERAKPVPGKPVSYADRIVNKANETWASFEKAPKGWKKQLTTFGNTVMKKIPYEEWGLKTIPALSAKRKEMEISQQEKVEVLYPRLFMKDSKVLEACKQLALERQPLHRKRAIWSAIGAPLTLPFALLPIIPNIPGFYLLFRAWSHWKALKGAQHLEFLVQNNLIKSSPSTALDQLYTAGLMYPSRQMSRVAPAPTPDQGEAVAEIVANQTNGGVEDVMLLQKWNGKLLAESFELPDMEVEIERAVEQVENSIKAKELLVKEKLEIESGTQPPGMSEKEAKLIAEQEINQAEEVKKV